MPNLRLFIANKNTSSWSLRPWLLMKTAGIAFEEIYTPFDSRTQNAHFLAFSPTKQVPALHDGKIRIWGTLAIMEYLAELYPEKNLWPVDTAARAYARSISSEIHAGFMSLREECPMHLSRIPATKPLSDATKTNIKRIEAIWADCLQEYGGPFLFGEFSIADAIYAPVVNRMEVYKLSDAPAVHAYSRTMKSLPAWQEWDTAARIEAPKK